MSAETGALESASVGGARPPRDVVFLAQLLVVGLSTTSLHAVRPMVTYRAIDLGGTAVEIGIIAAVFSIAPAIFAVSIGNMVDRRGESRFVMLAMAVMAIGALIAASAGSLLVLAASQMLFGIGHMTNVIAGQALVANRGGRDGREMRYGRYSMMASLGQMVGPLVAVTIVTSGVSASLAGATGNEQFLVFTAGAVICLGALVLAARAQRDARAQAASASAKAPEPSSGTRTAAVAVLRRPGMLLAMSVSMIVISALDVMIMYLPLYADERGLTVTVAGTLLAIRAGSSLASRYFMARLIARLGNTTLLVLSMVSAAVGLAAIPLTDSVVVLGLVMAVVGFGLGLGQPMTIAWVANAATREVRATALAVRITGNRVALVVTPLIVGSVAAVSGVGLVFTMLAVVLGLGAFTAYSRPLQTAPQAPAAPTG